MINKNSKNPEQFIEFIIDVDEPIYTTGVIQRLLDIPIWVIKQLDNEGVVSPPRKLVGSSRLYSKRELKKLAHCWVYMNEKGVNIKGLKVILEIEAKND
ncbi:MAG: MerR family transcriptional regulator [Candidatus Omnitrophica bacterium]|nr:MerR family transcriptional regulator [Candidatus Omnitrophota bacterium]